MRRTVISKLRSFAKEVLVNTSFNTEDEDFLVNQYSKVYALIGSLHKESPDILASIVENWDGDRIIPTVEEIGIEHMHNIGTSARTCLEHLNSQSCSISDEDLEEKSRLLRVEQFLKLVGKQAQVLSAKYYIAHSGKKTIEPDKFDDEIRERVKSFAEDYQKLVDQEKNELDKKLKELEEKLKELEEKRTAFNELETKLSDIASNAKKEVANLDATVTKAKTDAGNAKTAADEAKLSAENAKMAAKEILENITTATTAANEAKETAKEMLPNMLSALGILVGIVVAIVGCYLSILLGEHSNDITSAIGYSRPFEFARYLMMGHLTAMVVFLLMYLISRISRASLSCSCNNFYPKLSNPNDANVHDCSQCTKQCGIPTRFVRRYPYLFGINLACCIGYVLLAIWQFVNVYFREQIDAWIISMGLGNIFIIAMAVLFVVGICCYAFFSKKHK